MKAVLAVTEAMVNNMKIKWQNKFVSKKTLRNQMELLLKTQKQMMEKEHERDLLEQRMKYAELQNQINPHFLYNTLENIRAQAFIDGNETIAEMTEALSCFFRYNISKDNDIVNLSEELKNIQTYIQIQQYRFQDRFQFKIYYHDNENVVQHCKIPKMTLQPIVENAIAYGVENKIEQCHINVHIETTNEKVILLISDDGAGMDETVLQKLWVKLEAKKTEKESFSDCEYMKKQTHGNGIALVNINKRLRLLYGEEYGITSISSMVDVGTEVEITIPNSGEVKVEDEEA